MMPFYFNSAEAKDPRRGWRDFIDDKFGLSSVSLGNEATFAGEIKCSSLGFLTLTEIRATHEYGERTKTQVSKAQNEKFVLVLLRAGSLKVTQAGRACVLGPNMFTLFDCNAPYTFQHVEQTDVLDVSMPAGVVRARLKRPDDLVATPLRADIGFGRVVADFVQSLAREAPHIPDKVADSCAAKVADVFAVLFDSEGGDGLPIGDSAVRSAIYRRCVAFIEDNLVNPQLGPPMISAAVGISLRYLHKIFQASGESVGDYVRRRRLARSYEDLIDLRKRHLPIKEIAFRYGFRNPAHFSDAFKSQHGMSPRDMRPVSGPNARPSAGRRMRPR
jgi:AraC family transcriptional regulator, positive regulator of tynA and feaB